jgi:hypothetical protein
MEKQEFVFPDEKETEKKDVDIPAAEIDIEIVDDTPEEDRNRPPMKEPPEEVSDEELQNYSDGVKKRIQHFTKGYHEERRAKEAAIREKEEALRLTQSLMEQNKKLQANMGQSQQIMLEQAKVTLDSQLEAAKKKIKEAYEAGDTDGFIAAQEEFVEAKTKAEKLKAYKPALQPQQNNVQPQPTQVDPRIMDWRNKNPWFGADKRKTAVALAIHQELVEQGVDPSSDEYLKKLDMELSTTFPDAKPPVKEREEPVVAPVSRSVAPKKITLTKTQVQLAKRLGLTLEQYARQVAEDMKNAN